MYFYAFVLATLVLAQSPASKCAWEWTLDERLADRFDPAKIEEREQAYRSSHPQMGPDSPLSKGELRYRIDGRRNPELFVPHELFDALLTGLGPNESRRTNQREFYRKQLQKIGFDGETFWPALASVSGPYLALQDRVITRSIEADGRCRARYDALQSARELFGADRFDRLLYTVVAPTMQYGAGTTVPNPSERLRREAGGCQ